MKLLFIKKKLEDHLILHVWVDDIKRWIPIKDVEVDYYEGAIGNYDLDE